MATSPPASFLGIPRELRLQIYEELQEQNLECKVLKKWRGGHDSRGFYATPIRDPEARLIIPWLSLLLSCRAIAAEMQSWIRNQAQAQGDDKHSTYIMETDLGGQESQDMGNVIWQRIPCAPTSAKVLLVHCYTDTRNSFWGDGGPLNIVRSMYQTLNLFLHCGPRLNPEKPLQDGHLHLRELVIHMHLRQGALRSTRADGSTARRDAYTEMCGRISLILRHMGVLSGSFERVRITDGEEEYEFLIDSSRPFDGVVSDHLKRYGFDWGVGGARASKSGLMSL
ncbi:hypothetical protein LTR97_001105 [Elasticomyces elasticus]|uniref:F-box domain-containing protein n=1 Tax=Elasticomyces elasticus TaxID=574655 RepID=A0AAN8A5P1_9PEZI|nr:hypothetical protein LTR97_001105 [Elasticomyces elasticus]